MNVGLISYTPEAERKVAMAARLCYSPIGAAELEERLSEKQVQALVEKILAMGHFSTLEHVSFTFAIEGVSRVLTHQLVRHRIASYSQQSQRYVKEHEFEFIVPPAIAANPSARERFESLMEEVRTVYAELTAMGVHQEDARYCLTNATETKILVTMNARALFNFFELRCCARAQWEIRALALAMLARCREALPVIFAGAGARCERLGYCPEAERFTCGRYPRLDQIGPHSA